MGRQSMVAYIPFKIKSNLLTIYNSQDNKFQTVGIELWKEINNNFNEIILLDAKSEGSKKGFNFQIFNYIKFPIERVIISGGLTRSDVTKAKKMGLAGVSIDNSILYTEYSIKGLR